VHQKVHNDDAILTQKDYSLAFAAPSHDYPLLFWWVVPFKCLWITQSDGYLPFPVAKIQFDSFKNTTRRSLELPTINSLLSLVAMKTFCMVDWCVWL
jgi:hypothetical protein